MNADPDASDADADAEAADRRLQVELGTGAAVAVLFLVLRMLAVAHWDWHAVAAIADTFDFSDAFPIAFGTVAGQPILTGVLVAVLLPAFVMRLFWPADIHRGTLTLTTVLATVLLVTIAVSMTVTFHNPWTIVGSVAMCAVLIVMRVWWRTGVVHDVVVTISRRAGLLAAAAVLILAAVNDAPWMGEERITTDDGIIDGYVLEAEPGFLHVLTDERDVIIIPDASITDRELLD